MPERKKHTNPIVIFLCAALCLISAMVFTQSSANPLPQEIQRMPDSIVARETGAPVFASGGSLAQPEEDVFTSSEITSAPEEEAEPSESSAPTQETEEEDFAGYPVSPEAEIGVWTASGSHWMFLVNGTPYTGWLTDTDGKRYFFNKKGIMRTGWLDRGKKRYYLDLDGIMQTGKTVIDGETFEFRKDGSLKGYSPSQGDVSKTSAGKSEENSDDNSQGNSSDDSSEKKAAESSRKTSKKSKRKKTKAKGFVALTFDDGPSSFTDRLLDCLESNDVRATFFMVGTEIQSFPEELKRMEALGCELGNHSYSHTDLTTLDSAGIAEELNRTDSLISEQTGHVASLVRPPYGAVNDAVTASVSVPMILWSIDTRDWESQDPDQIVDIVMNEVTDGSIILMHDIFSTSVDAAEILIPKLLKEGYQLVTVHELAEAHNMELSTGTAYGSMSGQ